MRDSYYCATVSDFLKAEEDMILGKLARANTFDLEPQQKRAWLSQIKILKSQLLEHPQGYLFFEFSIPRMGKRVDILLLYKGIVFVIEFKVGLESFDRRDIDQVHGYALDLKNFHLGSHNLPVVPVLLATEASAPKQQRRVAWERDGVAAPMMSNADNLSALLEIFDALGKIEVAKWRNSGYRPTPTIIEAAQTLYRGHDVSEISRSDAGAINLQATAQRIDKIINISKRNMRKSICFVTGVPGAGKTLAGLNIATIRAERHKDEPAVFLSGNEPLVMVLREALARDRAEQINSRPSKTIQETKQFIQNIHHFRDEYIKNVNAPFEKVVVFDEAQRAWTEKKTTDHVRNKHGIDNFNQSEPEFLIRVMDRHEDWCVIICLIGGGQEINTGESGLSEWLTALKTSFPSWRIYTSDILEDKHYTIDKEAIEMLQATNIEKHQGLHLSVSMRSFRTEQLNAFVSEVLEGDAHSARVILKKLVSNYPVVVTRELDSARAWLRERARGNERFGLIASSGGCRLRAKGIHVGVKVDAPKWFLNNKGDVRSSYRLEEAATQFYIQGLELDWTCVCWDADLRRMSNKWNFHGFRGTSWQNLRQRSRQLYLLNGYRVLLTRARQGIVIFVPHGDDSDMTRLPEFYDETHEYLLECGVPSLDS